MNEKLSLVNSTANAELKGDVQARQKKPMTLYTNGVDEVPFRHPEGQSLPLLKNDDSPRYKPKEVWDTKAEVFDLDNEDDLKQYNKVIQMIGRRRAMHSFEKVEWNSDTKNFVIFLRWVELFMEVPETNGGLSNSS